MTQYEFDKLLEKYLQGACTPEEELLLDNWANRQMEHDTSFLPEEEAKLIKKQLWRRIRRGVLSHSLSFVRISWVRWGIAASIVFILSLFFQDIIAPRKSEFQSSKLKHLEYRNTTKKTQTLTLVDGSTVKLEPNSAITYPKKFNRQNRVIYLKGAAFFKVKRDSSRPFIVHTGTLVTEVLGTSFHIKQHEQNNTVEVAVVTGKVSVYTIKPEQKDEHNGLILTPNQRVVYDQVSQNIVPSIVENPLQLNTASLSAPKLDFEEASLQSVLDVLSTLYGIEFVISTDQIKDCTITADLNGLSMFTQLELICKSIDASYEKRGTVVFINGEGC